MMKLKVRAVLIASAVMVVLILLLAAPAYAAKDKHEPDNSLKTANKISLSTDVKSVSLQTHNFHSNADVDYVKFAASKDTTYCLKVLGTDKTNMRRWVNLTVYRYSSKKWRQVSVETTGGSVEENRSFKTTAAAEYAVRLRPWGDNGAGTTYGLRLITDTYPAVKPDAYEHTDNSRTPNATQLPSHPSWDATSYANSGLYRYGLYRNCQLHSISTESDSDWYTFTLPAGHTYEMVLDMGDRARYTVNLDFFDASGNAVGHNPFTCLYTEFAAFGWHTVMPKKYTYYCRVYGDGRHRFWYRIGLISSP